jgi:hypothetical protein
MRMPDFVERRYFGALKCIDKATGFHLSRSMQLSSDDLSFVRNRSSFYVIKQVTGLARYSESFETAPTEPPTASLSFDVEVNDPLGQYLPRMLEVALPRDADPANANDQASLFQAINVELYAAPNADIMANWSTVRVSIQRADPEFGQVPVAGGLLRVIRTSDDAVLSSGLSDQRGEALVIVPGVPITQFAEDPDEDDGIDLDVITPVVISEIPARLELSLIPAQTWPANPDLLELNHAANIVATENLTLRTGRMEKVAIQLS